MMFRITRITYFSILLVALLMGCDSSSDSPSPQSQQITEQAESVVTTDTAIQDQAGYPVEQENQAVIEPVVDLAYPVEDIVVQKIEVQSVTLAEIPQPQDGNAVVTGFLTDVDGQPYIGTLYAAETIESTDPNFPPLISFSEEESILAIQDSSTGQFVFEVLVPGSYGLILWSPVGNTVVDNADSGHSVLFTVDPGESLDLGTIRLP